jgi:hypothetical protein
VFTARYALSPYIKQIHFVSKGLIGVASLFVPLNCMYLLHTPIICFHLVLYTHYILNKSKHKHTACNPTNWNCAFCWIKCCMYSLVHKIWITLKHTPLKSQTSPLISDPKMFGVVVLTLALLQGQVRLWRKVKNQNARAKFFRIWFLLDHV